MGKVNEDGISITDPNGIIYVAGDEITRPDGTIIMVKSDYEGITDEDLRKYVPDARSGNGVIVASLNIKGDNATQDQVNIAIENAATLPLNEDDFIIEDDVKVNGSRSNSDQAFQRNEAGRWAYQGDDFLIMHDQQISSLGDPTEAQDAVNKKHLDDQITSANEYTDSSIQLMTDFFQAQITQIHDAVYSQYMAFDINSNQRGTFADYDDSYGYMFYLTVRLTGNRLVTGILEIPARTVAGTEVCNVISDTTSGSSNNLRFLNRQVGVDNGQGDPIYVTTIRIMRRKELVA